MKKNLQILGAIIAFLLLASFSFGQKTTIWTGGGSDNNWSTAGNWTNGIPANDDIVQFSGNTQTTTNNDLSLTIRQINFLAGATASFTINGNQITLSGSSPRQITNASSFNHNVNITVNLGDATTFSTSSTGNLTFGGTVTPTGSNRTLTVTASTGTTIIFNGNVTDNGGSQVLSITKNGAGQMNIPNGASNINFTGSFNIDGGKFYSIINAGKTIDAVLRIGVVVGAEAEFNVSAANTLSFTNAIITPATGGTAGNGLLRKTGPGVMTAPFGVNANFRSSATVEEGTLNVNAGLFVAQINRFSISGTSSVLEFQLGVASTSTGTIILPHNSGTVTFNNNFGSSNNVSLNKTGAGVVRFTGGDKSTSGNINIQDGEMITVGSGFPAAVTTIANGKRLTVQGATVTRFRDLRLRSEAVLTVDNDGLLRADEFLRVQYDGATGPNFNSAINRVGFNWGATLEYDDAGSANPGTPVVTTTEWSTAIPPQADDDPNFFGPYNINILGTVVLNMAIANGSRTIPGELNIAANARLRLPERPEVLTLTGGGGIGDGAFIGSRLAQLKFDRPDVDLGEVTTIIRFDQVLTDGNHLYDFNVEKDYIVDLQSPLFMTDGLGTYSGSTFISSDPLGVGFFSIGEGQSQFITNDQLYFLSTRNGTAILGRNASDKLDNGFVGNYYADIYVSGKDGAENNIFGNPDRRQWRLMSIGQRGDRTIGQSWQRDGTLSQPGFSLISNADVAGFPIPDQSSTAPFGTLITGHQFPNAAAANAAGYDFWSGLANVGTSSLRRFTLSGGSWGWRSEADNNLISQTLDNKESAYMLFIRGNRTHTVPNTTGSDGFDSVILRTYGRSEAIAGVTLTYTQGVGNDKYVAFGNPYSAPIDLASNVVNAGTGLRNRFYYWNPALGARGGYQLYTQNSGSGSPFRLNSVEDAFDIEIMRAGQGVVLVRRVDDWNSATGNAASQTLTIPDGAKISGRNIGAQYGFDPFETTVSNDKALNVWFKSKESNGAIRRVESAAAIFREGFSKAVDDEDGDRLANFAANLGFGFRRNGTNLVMECLPLPAHNDTIYFRTLGLTAGTFYFDIQPFNLSEPGLEAFLRDNFTGTERFLDLGSKYEHEFTVTSDAASASPSRFSVIFRQSSTLPVTFTDISVVEKSGDASVNWSTATERGVRHFEVEYSPNGRDFARVGTVAAQNTATAQYNYLHSGIGEGKHFYRVRSVDLDGKTALTRVVNVEIGKGIEGFGVYPTVITEGSVTLRLNSLPKGRYNVQVTDMSGKVMMAAPLQHNGGTANQTMRLPAMSNGAYNVRLQGDNGQTYIQRVMKQ